MKTGHLLSNCSLVVLALVVIVAAVGCWPVYGPAWSPDGTKILYPYLVDTDTYGLALHDRTTGESRVVYEFAKGSGIYWVGWKPDGTAAVAITDGGPEGPCVFVLDATSWHLIRRIPVPSTAVNAVVIVGHYLVATQAFPSDKRKIIRVDLRNGKLVERKTRATQLVAVGDDLYFVDEWSSLGKNQGHVFGRVNVDTLESRADFTVPGDPEDRISAIAVDGDRIALVTHKKNGEAGATLRLFEDRRLERLIPLDDAPIPNLFAIHWFGETLRAIGFSNPETREVPNGGLEVSYVDAVVCEVDLEAGPDTCKRIWSDGLPAEQQRPVTYTASWSPDGRWLARSGRENLKLLDTSRPGSEAFEIAHPSSTYALPAAYESLGHGVLVSGFEKGSAMLRLERARSLLLRDLRKRGVPVANGEAGIKPLIVGERRLPRLTEEVGSRRRNSLLHLTVASHSMRLECFDSSGTALWTEEVTGRSYVRKLWKAMRKRLVEHADQTCLEATTGESLPEADQASVAYASSASCSGRTLRIPSRVPKKWKRNSGTSLP